MTRSRAAVAFVALLLAAVFATAFSATASATTYTYCTNVHLGVAEGCRGPRHSLTFNSGTTNSPAGGVVCENVSQTTTGTSFPNGWKCVAGYSSRSYAGSHLYYPYISYSKPPDNSGGARPQVAFLSGSAIY